MKTMIIGIASYIIFVMSILFTNEYNDYIIEYENLKYAADEAAATANLYLDNTYQSDGKRVFNQVECEKAIRDMLRKNLKLDSGLNPMANSYWKERVTYRSYYLDETTITYPYLFQDGETGYTKLITEPTVVVTVDAGKPPIIFTKDVIFRAVRTSGYEGLEE